MYVFLPIFRRVSGSSLVQVLHAGTVLSPQHQEKETGM